MTDLEKEKVNKVKRHFSEVAANGTGSLSSTDLRDALQENMQSLAKRLTEFRLGKVQDKLGNAMPAHDLRLSDALMHNYGCVEKVTLANGQVVNRGSIRKYLEALGIRMDGMSFNGIAQRFGVQSLTVANVEDILINHNSFAAPNSTAGIDPNLRFILAELIFDAIYTGYLHNSLASNWIMGTMSMGEISENAKMPRIENGDGMPYRVNQGAAISMGTIAFGQKEVSTFKTGIGAAFTDELLFQSKINQIYETGREIGNKTGIGRDVYAIDTLINGEQADGSESTPFIGVADPTVGVQQIDIDRLKMRMRRLGRPATRIITGETMSFTDLNANYTNRDRITLEEYVKMPLDCFPLANELQLLMLSVPTCMVELLYGTMKMERRRDIQTQKEEIFISQHFGFAKVRRDGVVGIDGTQQYSSTVGQANAFPAYMDINAFIQQAFRNY